MKKRGNTLSGREKILLSPKQREVLMEFYSLPHTKVIFNKATRKKLEKAFADTREIPDLNLKEHCPAILAEFQKAKENDAGLQQAVFSECVYAQTLANMLGLTDFSNFSFEPDCLSNSIVGLLNSYHLNPRYVYKSKDGARVLIQAGGNAGTDGAIITIDDQDIFTIEFKEPLSKTSEPDIPLAYDESGQLALLDSFLVKYPQFERMLKEQKDRGLNFWAVRGTNVKDFGLESIKYAVSENYSSKKFADVICVEDRRGYLTMIPANQMQLWSKTMGELRPVGRNTLEVWTPNFLMNDLASMGAIFNGDVVSLPMGAVTIASKRGSNGNSQSRFRFGKVFMVRIEHALKTEDAIHFNLDKVRQVKPTISAHMDFKELDIQEVQRHYEEDFKWPH